MEISTPNPDLLLRPGMFARVSIEFARHDNATTVPVSALTKRQDSQCVFLVAPAPPDPEPAAPNAGPGGPAKGGAANASPANAKGPRNEKPVKTALARFVPVTVGIVTSEFAEILDPPLSGEVITLGHHLVEDGSRIIPTNSTAPEETVAAETGGRQ